jgi:hypothetical protein
VGGRLPSRHGTSASEEAPSGQTAGIFQLSRIVSPCSKSHDPGARSAYRASPRSLAKVVNEVSDEVVGFGPVEFLLKDPGVTEGLLTKRVR